jgi:flagellar biosynthesis protein FlhF
MQIKRFEAADMTEALRMVKREFGADAVILSAREVRSGGFLGALRKKRVEITAAADYSTQDPHDGAPLTACWRKS